MTKPSAFLLAPEPPSLVTGGGGLRTASLAAYLRQKYVLDLAHFDLPAHSRSSLARAARNSLRLIRGRPPLFDRYSGFEDQVARQIQGHYRVAVIEHFWCAAYAPVLRPHTDLLVLDLHNIESALALSHASAITGLESGFFRRCAIAYRKLEREWLPQFDLVLVASGEDRARVALLNRQVIVYPNAMPVITTPNAHEAHCIVFSGNFEYHPNVEAVRWFHREVWPRVRGEFPELEWWLVGRNPHAIASVISGDRRIRATGPVDDALALIAQAQAVVVPLRSGSGTRFKILEAWAARRVVVSTAIGAEGLGASHQENILLADTAEHFGDALRALLSNAVQRKKLGESGRALYEERYTWPVAWEELAKAGI